MTARAFFALPFAELSRRYRALMLRWRIANCERDLLLIQRELRERHIAQRELTIELINLQSQRNAL